MGFIDSTGLYGFEWGLGIKVGDWFLKDLRGYVCLFGWLGQRRLDWSAVKSAKGGSPLRIETGKWTCDRSVQWTSTPKLVSSIHSFPINLPLHFFFHIHVHILINAHVLQLVLILP